MSSVLCRLRCLLSHKERKILGLNVQRVYGLRPGTHFAEIFLEQVFRLQIQTALETLWEGLLPGLISWDGEQELRDTLHLLDQCDKGKILVTAHLGSWDLVGHVVARNSRWPMHVLAKTSKYKLADRLMNFLRTRFGMKVLYSGKKSSLVQMSKCLQKGSWLGFVMDQKPAGRVGPKVDFFAKKTAFVSGPATFALRSDLPVLSVFCVRIGPFHYRVLSKLIEVNKEGGADVQSLSQVMASEIERVVRLYPEQWCWNYKRWRFTAH